MGADYVKARATVLVLQGPVLRELDESLASSRGRGSRKLFYDLLSKLVNTWNKLVFDDRTIVFPVLSVLD